MVPLENQAIQASRVSVDALAVTARPHPGILASLEHQDFRVTQDDRDIQELVPSQVSQGHQVFRVTQDDQDTLVSLDSLPTTLDLTEHSKD